MKIKGNEKLRTKNPANPFLPEEKPKKLIYYVGLNGTLATYDRWGCVGDIGEPIPTMKARVLHWLKEGIKIKIFTARACNPENIKHVRKWLFLNGFSFNLEITNIIGTDCDMIFDDKAREIIHNTGIIVDRTGEFKKE